MSVVVTSFSNYERACRPTLLETVSIIRILIDQVHKSQNTYFKGTLAGLRQFLATESPLKMMKNAFYFTSKALFVLKIFKFLS